MREKWMNAPCTIMLAAINVIVFIVLSFYGMTEDGMFLLEHGAMYVPRVKEAGESYRLKFTVSLPACFFISASGI